jgi:hypothetical protein
VVDALTWHDAPSSLLEQAGDAAEWDQLLVRALLYRIATNEAAGASDTGARVGARLSAASPQLILARARAG